MIFFLILIDHLIDHFIDLCFPMCQGLGDDKSILIYMIIVQTYIPSNL